MFITFLLSFIVSRTIVYFFPGLKLLPSFTSPYHLHHFFLGVIVLIVSNIIFILAQTDSVKRVGAGVLGIGLGLVFDEFGLILACGTGGYCDPDALYWSRLNYDIVLFVALILLILVYSEPLWHRHKEKVLHYFR